MPQYAYDVFIFYSPSDRRDARELAEVLAKAGIKVFFEPWSLVPGVPREKQLGEALQESRSGIAVLGLSDFELVYETLLNKATSHMDVIIPVYYSSIGAKMQSKYDRLDDRPGVTFRGEKSLDQLIAIIKDPPLERPSVSCRTTSSSTTWSRHPVASSAARSPRMRSWGSSR